MKIIKQRQLGGCGYIAEKALAKAIEDALYTISAGKLENNKRKFIYHTGKLGCIGTIKAFYKQIGSSEEEINEIVEKAKVNLKDGIYRMDSSSLSLYEYLGNYKQ